MRVPVRRGHLNQLCKNRKWFYAFAIKCDSSENKCVQFKMIMRVFCLYFVECISHGTSKNNIFQSLILGRLYTYAFPRGYFSTKREK